MNINDGCMYSIGILMSYVIFYHASFPVRLLRPTKFSNPEADSYCETTISMQFKGKKHGDLRGCSRNADENETRRNTDDDESTNG